MKRSVTFSLLAFFISLQLSPGVHAQDTPVVDIGKPSTADSHPLPFKPENVGNVQGPGFKAEGVFIGTPLQIDADFAAQHGIPPLNAPFKVTVPKDKNLFFLPGGKKTGTPELARLTLATEDKKAVEILRFVTLTVPLQPTLQERLVVCANLLKSKALPQIVKGYEQAQLLDLYTTKVHGHDAVCLLAEMIKPGTGEAYWVKTTGILPGESEHGIMAFLMADKKLSVIKSPQDLTSKGFGLRVIHSLEFLPKPAGQPDTASSGKAWAGSGPLLAGAGPTGDPATLKALFEKYHAAMVAQDVPNAATITRSLLPDETRLKVALGPGVSPEVLAKVLAFHATLPKGDDAALARLLSAKPSQTQVSIHAATTEELALYADGSTASAEFPGASRDLAKAGILKPGLTFYEVEFLEPGSDSGMKYHLFYWDGTAWSMLGPIWRALK